VEVVKDSLHGCAKKMAGFWDLEAGPECSRASIEMTKVEFWPRKRSQFGTILLIKICVSRVYFNKLTF
jgi:hypothetical protein